MTRRSTVLADVHLGRLVADDVVHVGASPEGESLTTYVLLSAVALATVGYFLSGGCLCGTIVGGLAGAVGGGLYSNRRKVA